MVEPKEKKAFMINTSPIKEEEDRDIDDYREAVSPTGLCCFGLCERQPSHHDGESRSLLHQKEEQHHKDTWMVKKAKEIREVSEMVAGPRWKNFIRKNGKYFNTKKSRPQQVQYDPQCYALNFDHTGLDEEEDEGMLLGFSSRFAPPFSGELPRQVVL